MFSNNRKPAPPGSAETTLIAAGVVVHGDVHFAGNLHLEGRIEGTVSADADSEALFTLSEKGSVVGEIDVPHAVINGEVEGNIASGKRLELAAAARVRGDVRYVVLEMAAGATVEGRMVHVTNAPPQLAHLSNTEGERDDIDPEAATA